MRICLPSSSAALLPDRECCRTMPSLTSTATNWLNALVVGGVLQDVKAGRERIFINVRFFELLLRPESAPTTEPTLF